MVKDMYQKRKDRKEKAMSKSDVQGGAKKRNQLRDCRLYELYGFCPVNIRFYGEFENLLKVKK